ncbi:GLOBIN domain-containing protein, partial [Trichostrongylus colubriformis]
FQKLDDPKEIVGVIFVDIVNDTEPELKKVFGVERAPKAGMLKMPKFGGHVARFTDFIDQTTTMLGFTENLSGAWQLVRKTGRIHVTQSFLEQNQNQFEKNYFEVVLTTFIESFIPYLTGEKVSPEPEGNEKKKVRFANNYNPSQVADVWKRFFSLINAQMTDAFELERTKRRNAQSQKTLAPHQHVEESERKKKRIQEKQSELENTGSSHEPKEQEQMFEDPF